MADVIEMTDDLRDRFAKLREPFTATQIHGLPRGGSSIDYVGHADVTSRLLEVDPAWDWAPMALDEQGLPLFEFDGDKPVGLWIRLTVLGVTRLGYGSVEKGKSEAVKILIGDALRNAAMRFGVALDLWSKSDRVSGGDDNGGGHSGRRQSAQRDRSEPTEPSVPANGGGSRTGPPPGYLWKGDQAKVRVTTIAVALGAGHDAIEQAVAAMPAEMVEADCHKLAGQIAAGAAPVPGQTEASGVGPCDQCGHTGALVPYTDPATGVEQHVCEDEPACVARLDARAGAR